MAVADQSMTSGVFAVQRDHSEAHPVVVRVSRRELEAIGTTRWASPPPGVSTNLLIFSTLGLWLAVLLLLRGEQLVLWVLG